MKERSYLDRARIYHKVAESPRYSSFLAKFQGIDPDNRMTPSQKQAHYKRTAQCHDIYFGKPTFDEKPIGENLNPLVKGYLSKCKALQNPLITDSRREILQRQQMRYLNCIIAARLESELGDYMKKGKK